MHTNCILLSATVAIALTWRPPAVDLRELKRGDDEAVLAFRRGLRAGAVVIAPGDSGILSAASKCFGLSGEAHASDGRFSSNAVSACPEFMGAATLFRALARDAALAGAALADRSAVDATEATPMAVASVRDGMLIENYIVSQRRHSVDMTALPDVGMFLVVAASTHPKLTLRNGRIVVPEVPRGGILLLVGDGMRLFCPELRPMPVAFEGSGIRATASFSISEDVLGQTPLSRAEPSGVDAAVNVFHIINNDGSVAPEVSGKQTRLVSEEAVAPFCDSASPMTMHMSGFMTIAQGRTDTCINFLFTSFTLTNTIRFIVAAAASFSLGFIAEALLCYRRKFKGSVHMKTICYFLNINFGYAVMLIVMTYSVELTLAAMLGLTFGHYFFNIHATITDSVSPCCVVRAPSANLLASRHYRVHGMMCQACAMTVKGALTRLDFVEDADVNYKEGRAVVYISPNGAHKNDNMDREVVESVEDVGFEAEVWQGSPPALAYTPPAVSDSRTSPLLATTAPLPLD